MNFKEWILDNNMNFSIWDTRIIFPSLNAYDTTQDESKFDDLNTKIKQGKLSQRLKSLSRKYRGITPDQLQVRKYEDILHRETITVAKIDKMYTYQIDDQTVISTKYTYRINFNCIEIEFTVTTGEEKGKLQCTIYCPFILCN